MTNVVPQKPEIQLMNSVGEEKSIELITDILEVGFDKITDSELLKDLPVFGGFVKAYKAFYSIKEQLFLKKVSKFLIELKDVPHEKRLEFLKELEQEGKKEEVGETLLIILEKLYHMEKPKILGRLLKARIEGHIDLNKFLRLSNAVSKVFIYDLYRLEYHVNQLTYEENVTEELFNVGLVYDPSAGISTITMYGGDPNLRFVTSKLGIDLLNFGLNDQ
jgi:hypothetical protein